MRKIRITVLALALALAALCTATALAAGTQAGGDVNGSGDLNMTDMQCLYDLLSTDKYSGSLTDEAGRRAADINGDGTVDILDYQRLYDILRQQVDYDNPVYEYDENGRAIRKCYYDATGKVNRYLVYEYGADGRKSAAVCYNADGSVRYNCKIEYRADDWAEWTYYDPETNKVLGVDMDDANGVLRQSTKYNTDTGKAVFAWEFDEKERMVDYKEFSGDTLAFHWAAVYDEDGIETRTCYDPATNKVTWIEIRDANGTLRKFTEYNTDTGKVVCVQEFDEKERMVDYKEFSGDTLAFHWTAVYDESGIETRTYYDAATGKVTGIEIRDANGTRRKSTEYDTDTGKAVCVREFDEKERMVDYKEFSGDTLAFHWTAVYDEDGIETRTYYDPTTNKVAGIEIRDANGMLRKFTEYNTDTGKVVCVREFDEKERMVDCKEFSGDTLAFHWTAVYDDEDGIETRTYYDPATNKVTGIEVFDANGTLRKFTEYNTDTGKVVCVQEYDETGTLRKFTEYNTDTGKVVRVWEYDENGAVRKFTEYNTDTGKVVCVQEYDENGVVRKYTSYDRETGEILSVSEFDEQGRAIDFKEFNNGTLSFHWSAVYDESGAEIRTYYDTVTGSVSNIEKREYDRTNKTCTITQYDVQTDKMYCVQVWEMNGEDDWKLIKTTYYDENGNVTSETVY